MLDGISTNGSVERDLELCLKVPGLSKFYHSECENRKYDYVKSRGDRHTGRKDPASYRYILGELSYTFPLGFGLSGFKEYALLR